MGGRRKGHRRKWLSLWIYRTGAQSAGAEMRLVFKYSQRSLSRRSASCASPERFGPAGWRRSKPEREWVVRVKSKRKPPSRLPDEEAGGLVLGQPPLHGPQRNN